MTADAQLDDDNLFDRVVFSDGAVVDYQWNGAELTGLVLTDNLGAMFFFDFVDGRLYQTDFLGIAQPIENPLRLEIQPRLSPADCALREATCAGITVFGGSLVPFCHLGLVAAGPCYALGAAASILGVVCLVTQQTVCSGNDPQPGSGNWCTVTRGDKVCTSGPYAACQIQHANFGEPSPFLGMSERDDWWSKSCEWNTCGGLARPDCTLILPSIVIFECEDRINFEREFPGNCVPRNQSN